MTSVSRMGNARFCRIYFLPFLLIALCVVIVRDVSQRLALIYCYPLSLNSSIVDQDEWQYQSSIDGQWYRWETEYKRRPKDEEWRVTWLNVAPSSSFGVIIYLAKRSEIDSLNISLAQLYRILLFAKPRPVVIFHEGDLGDNNTQQSLARTVGSRTPLAFERVYFSNTSKQPESVHRNGWTRGYMNMCRFFAIMLYTHPLLRLFSFYWRLDTHSFLIGTSPINDPFELMQQKQIQYAFVMTNEDDENYVHGLWALFHQFLEQYCLKPSPTVRQTQTGWFGWYSYAIIYNNFAITNISFFRDNPIVRAWLHTVDREGGIYRHRWGDAPIHTLIISQLLERHQVLQMRHFGYMHRREYVCAVGTQSDLCDKQSEPFFNDRIMRRISYRDGCYPDNNRLCHFYPETSS